MGEIICFYGFSGNYLLFLIFKSNIFEKGFFSRALLLPADFHFSHLAPFSVLFASPPSPSLDKRRFRLPRLT